MNLDLKTMGPRSASQIDSFICILNSLRSADGHIRFALGEERSGPSKYTHVKESHVEKVVEVLKNALGADSDALFGGNRKKRAHLEQGRGLGSEFGTRGISL